MKLFGVKELLGTDTDTEELGKKKGDAINASPLIPSVKRDPGRPGSLLLHFARVRARYRSNCP